MRREFSKQVRRDAFLRAKGCCEGKDCGVKLDNRTVEYDHNIPDWMGGEPTLENCVVLCKVCHKQKTGKKDIPVIAKTKRLQDRRMGIRNSSRLPGTRASGIRKRMDGTVERW